MRSFIINILHLDGLGEYIEAVTSHFSQVFPGSFIRLEPCESGILENAYDSSRRQHHSTIILRNAARGGEHTYADRILVIVDVDLFVPSLNFVFGEAQHNGRYAIISTYRLKPQFYGERNGGLFVSRVNKEATHELGHTLGALHCRNSACVMFFSNSIADTDRKNETFCSMCGRKISEALNKL